MKTIPETEYNEIKGRNDKHNAWVDTIRDKNGWVSYRPEDKPANVPDVSNEERGKLELYEFVHDPPAKYLLYIDEKRSIATTWPGDELGKVSFGRQWRDNFGGTRQSVTVRAVNGRTYSGTYFKSAGNYARVQSLKRN